MAVNNERFVKAKRFTTDFDLEDSTDQVRLKASAVVDAVEAALTSDTGARAAIAAALVDKGTWIPTLEGATIAGTGWAYSAATSGSFTRTGDGWIFNGVIVLTAKSGDATGQIQIGSFPFTFPNSNNIQGCISVECSNMTTSIVSSSANPVLNASKIGLQLRTAASASPSSMVLANLSDTAIIRFSGSATI